MSVDSLPSSGDQFATISFNNRLWQDARFAALWSVIILVAVIDGYYMLINHEIIVQTELNPVGRFLLALDQGEVRYFFLLKCCGTIITSSVLLVIYWKQRSRGLATTTGVALFQLGLLKFLIFGS